ncbi:glycosyltransferase family 4 protein [Algivirga pacifica]|uniref:Glycosyltransferase n=1 Tax=Algivirga pacifica TaxID=1162670 RepID=A0ABP9D8E6_9BACT
MNILIITCWGGMAGSTNSISYLSRGLAERGHNVYVGCPEGSLLYNLLEDSKAILVPMKFKGKLDLDNMRHIRDLVKEHNIQLINAQASYDRYTVGFAKWLYNLPVKIIHTRRQKPESIGGFLQNWFYTKSPDKIVAVGHEIKKQLVQKGLPESHIEVIYNGTPAEKYELKNPEISQELRKRYDIHKDEVVIGVVSRKKQQSHLLSALQYIEQPLTVLLAGVEEFPEYKAITDKYEVPHHIIYAGKVDAKEILYFYDLFTIKVLASNMEGLSQSLLEAMALGVPVIGTRAAGNIDLIEEGVNGLFFEEGDAVQLAKQIERLLKDKELQDRLIANGRKTAFEDFSIEKVIDNYERFFREQIEG